MKKQNTGDFLMGFSALAALISGFVFLTQSSFLDLAGTQWILIAVIFALYGIYAKMKMKIK
jgi:hypothetical protein